MLHPAEAVPLPDGTLPSPTIYQPRRLLVPRAMLSDGGAAEVLRDVLLDLRLTFTSDPKAMPADLVPIDLLPHPDLPPNTPIDAWTALRALRSTDRGQGTRFAELAHRLGLRHLLSAATFPGQDVATRRMTGGPGGMEGHYEEATGRRPVRLPMAVPALRAGAPPHRRPVVAVLDSGCGQHPWLDTESTDPFVVRCQPEPPFPDPELMADIVDPLRGELDSHCGHGTFVTGIIRQLAPDATVWSYRVMQSDGVVDEHHLDAVLTSIAEEVWYAQQHGVPGSFVDLVLMPFGGYFEDEAPLLHAALTRLDSLGVGLVAAAGNDASTVPHYPAAFDEVVGVGASTRTGVPSIYSNAGANANVEAPGYALVSTLPQGRDGSRNPVHRTHTEPCRESFDPDRFATGFGTWSGTSFAAAMFAGRVAAELWSSDDLADITPAGADRRWTAAVAAVSGVPWS
ncbi:MAG TPA: S8/S53 family peptidase [Pseudonocardiaceae bacterium]